MLTPWHIQYVTICNMILSHHGRQIMQLKHGRQEGKKYERERQEKPIVHL